MSKRNKSIIETAESKALKTMRLKSELSVRKLADRMNISKTRVSQMESGRENIPKDYIFKFITCLDLSWGDWEYQISKVDNNYGLRDKCHELVKEIEPSKLEEIYDMLSSF